MHYLITQEYKLFPVRKCYKTFNVINVLCNELVTVLSNIRLVEMTGIVKLASLLTVLQKLGNCNKFCFTFEFEIQNVSLNRQNI